MLIGQYLQWVETAPVRARVDAAQTLVEAYSSPGIDTAGRLDAELALFALLDDPSSTVRRALSEAVACTADVPRHLVVALAHDHSAVAVPVLRYSPLLSDADLVDAAAIGDTAAQVAIATRPLVRAPLAAALAEVGTLEALLALCDNAEAELMPCTMQRMLARFGDDGALREALLNRDELDVAVRHDLLVATAHALTSFAASCDWLSPERAERVARESRERGVVTIAARSARQGGPEGLRCLVAHLRALGHLTPALILRALLSGSADLFEAALADLAEMPCRQVAGHVRHHGGIGFASLYARAKMPAPLLPVFRAALAGSSHGHWVNEGAPGALRRTAIAHVIEACGQQGNPNLDRATALLRRFEAEAIREEARALTAAAWAEDEGEALPALMPWIIGSAEAAPRLTFQPAL